MQADKAGHGQISSNSLRTSQPSTTKLGDSDKLLGTLMHRPESSEEGVSVAIQLPADGTGNSLSVRPAATQAVQLIGDLSRLGEQLRDARQAQTNKRTQSQAGIDEENVDTGSMSKRQRTEDTAVAQPRGPDNAYVNPVSPSAWSISPLPAAQIVPQPSTQPLAQPQVVPPEPAFAITPDMQAQIATAEVLRLATSNTSFQPEKISELFQYLCRAQLWPLLKLEEQRVQQLMNLDSVLPAPYRTGGFADAGAAVNVPSTSTTTTAMQPGWRTVNPLAGTASSQTSIVPRRAPRANLEFITRPLVTTDQMTQIASGSNASKVSEHLLPDAPNPPSPDYAQSLLSSLPQATQDMMKLPGETIRKRLSLQRLELESINNMTAFTAYLVETVSHGDLPHLAGELADIVNVLLEVYLKSHRQFESKNMKARKAESAKTRSALDPVYTYVLRLLPQYPQFARVLGIGLNNLSQPKRSHLGLARKFNAVLELMRDRRSRSLPDMEFKQRLDTIVDDASVLASSSGAKTASTPTSASAKPREDDSDEGSDGAL